MWDVEYTEEFGEWWRLLEESEQDAVAAVVGLLERLGPRLPFPYSSRVNSSRHTSMRELRIQHRGGPYRVLYAFDSRRTALLLVGGCKVGDDRWYERMVPRADRILTAHLEDLDAED